MNNGQTMEQLLSRLFPGSFRNDDLTSVREEIRKSYLEMEEEGVKLIPGVKVALQKLRDMELKIGIATARMSPEEVKWREVRRLGIDQYIDAMVNGAEAERKPAAGALLECIRRLELSPDRMCYGRRFPYGYPYRKGSISNDHCPSQWGGQQGNPVEL